MPEPHEATSQAPSAAPLKEASRASPSWPAAWPVGHSSRSRCPEKGCVFPAGASAQGLCAYHERFLREPDSFTSLQPTLLVVAQAIFVLPDPGQEDFRAADRRRLAEERATFYLEEAA